MNDTKKEMEQRIECWPKDGFEFLDSCPVCSGVSRKILHNDLKDLAFKCAPGEWILHRCGSCGAAYLSPRPNRETIGLAYREYYTHQSKESGNSYFKNMKISMINGYRNMKYGVEYSPASVLGILYYLFPARRKNIDSEGRGLKSADDRKVTRVLDVGCGNGRFLALAGMMGCSAFGVEPDAGAVKAAGELDVEILGDFVEDIPETYNGYFDVVTLSQVIEHVHDPGQMIEKCYDLLTDGGRLWVSTPNIDSQGHRYFGKYWRGLESPRHLTIFDWNSLHRLLSKKGFVEIKMETARHSCKWMFKESSKQKGEDIGKNDGFFGKMKLRIDGWRADYHARLNPASREFITLNCIKRKKNT